MDSRYIFQMSPYSSSRLLIKYSFTRACDVNITCSRDSEKYLFPLLWMDYVTFREEKFLEGNQLDIWFQVLLTSFLRCHVALKAFSISSHGLPSFKKFGQQLQLLERNPSGTPSLVLVKSFLRGQVALTNLRISSCG